jgi:branched-chain amino acid aminotransferase
MNGGFVDIDKARISVFDRGFLYGDGVFETMRSYAGVIFRLEAHLKRLFGALRETRIKSPFSRKELKDALYKCLDVNALKSAYIRLTVTRGEGRFGIDFNDRFSPNIVIVAKEFGEYPVSMYSRGISAAVVDLRQNEYGAVTRMKTLNFLNYILARFRAKERHRDEAILKNTKGCITEAATSNIFLVKRKRLITPSLESGVLGGITRDVVIGLAGSLGFKVLEKAVAYEELINADEVFLTNSLIDSKAIGLCRPGDSTKLLHITYQKEVIKETLGKGRAGF